MNSEWQTWLQPGDPAAFLHRKESTLKLSLETRNRGDIMIVHCQGRIVFREEAAALSRLVNDVLQNTSKVVLDLSGVSSMDSAGIGELAFLQSWARARNVDLKCASPNSLVRNLLDLTNLDRVLEIHPSLTAALESFSDGDVRKSHLRENRLAEGQACADC